MKIKESNLIETIRRVFCDFKKVCIRNRQGKKYLIVSMEKGNREQHYNYIISLKSYLTEHFNSNIRITSAGGGSATFRIN